MAVAGLPDLGRKALVLEREVTSDLARISALLNQCPPAIPVLVSLQEELGGSATALESALKGLGEAGPAIARGRDGFSAEDGAASTALAFLGGRLNEAALTCSALHAVAHRAFQSTGDGNVADLAEAQMLAYLTAAAAIGEVLSDVAVWELEQAGMECDCHCGSCSAGICICARHGKETVAKARQSASSRPSEEGIVVRRPRTGSRAALAGLQAEDVIATAAEQPIAGPIDLLRAIRDVPAGSDIVLTIRRGETTRQVVLKPA